MKRSTVLWLLAGFVGLIVIGIWADKQKPASQRWPQEIVAPHDLLCGRGRSDANDVIRAVNGGDRAGIAGLIGRNKILMLSRGTLLHVDEPLNGLVYMRVRSGAQIGETCWAPEGWLLQSR